MKKSILFLLFLLSATTLWSQDQTYGEEKTTMDRWEDELGMMGQVVLRGRTDSIKRIQNEYMRAGFEKCSNKKRAIDIRSIACAPYQN